MSWETIERRRHRHPARAAHAGERGGGRRGAEQVEREIRRIGRELAAAFPSTARHPVRAIDSRAMELASSDRELRAALFRFVDVVPACRSLDDLARHLTAFLEEVPDAPLPISAAMRIGNTRAGRTALGAAAAGASGTWLTGSSSARAPRRRSGVLRAPVGARRRQLGRPAGRGDRHRGRGRPLRGALRRGACGSSRTAARRWPSRPMLEHDSVGPLPRANVSVKVSALTPLLRPDAPERGRARRGRTSAAAARAARADSAPTSTSTWSRWTRARPCSSWCSRSSPRRSSATGPSAGIVLQAYLRDSPEQLDAVLEWARADARTPPLTVRLVKGAYWDHELVRPASTAGRRRCSRSRPTATATSRR